MGIKFKSNNKSFKKKLKTSFPFVAAGVVLAGILSLLIFPQRISNAIERDNECKKLGLNGGGHLFYDLCDNNFDKIIFVVGDTVNTPKPTLGFPELIKKAYTGASGIYAMSVSRPSKNPRRINIDEKEDITTTVTEYIEKMSATEDGADYLEAIRTAANFAGADRSRTLIYVIGSGLSDRGLLNFADDNLLTINQSTDDIVGKIQKEIDDPNELESITIFWDGLGEVVPPQIDLSTDSRIKLQEIYENMLIELSVNEDDIIIKDRDFYQPSSTGTAYLVKTSQAIQKSIVIDVYKEGETKAFSFRGGEDVLVDEAATIEQIKKYANDKSIKSFSIAAKVSRGGECREQPDFQLIKKRYNRIIELFEQNGISRSLIKTEKGSFGPEADCIDGVFQGEGIAAKNRYVEIKVER